MLNYLSYERKTEQFAFLILCVTERNSSTNRKATHAPTIIIICAALEYAADGRESPSPTVVGSAVAPTTHLATSKSSVGILANHYANIAIENLLERLALGRANRHV